MTETTHPNLAVLMQLDLQNLDACESIFADDFIWHYFNPMLPDLEGDHLGLEGLKGFFVKLGETTNHSFQVNLVDARPAGDELIVVQVCNRMELEDNAILEDNAVLDGNAIELDAVVVWRVVDGKIAEGWDIPAVNTVRTPQKS